MSESAYLYAAGGLVGAWWLYKRYLPSDIQEEHYSQPQYAGGSYSGTRKRVEGGLVALRDMPLNPCGGKDYGGTTPWSYYSLWGRQKNNLLSQYGQQPTPEGVRTYGNQTQPACGMGCAGVWAQGWIDAAKRQLAETATEQATHLLGLVGGGDTPETKLAKEKLAKLKAVQADLFAPEAAYVGQIQKATLSLATALDDISMTRLPDIEEENFRDNLASIPKQAIQKSAELVWDGANAITGILGDTGLAVVFFAALGFAVYKGVL